MAVLMIDCGKIIGGGSCVMMDRWWREHDIKNYMRCKEEIGDGGGGGIEEVIGHGGDGFGEGQESFEKL